MIYYRLTTVFGYLLMAVALIVLAGYLLLFIFVSGFFGHKLIFNTWAGCFIASIVLFQIRSLVVDNLTERISRHGQAATAQVLAMAHVGGRHMGKRAVADWRQLKVKVLPMPGISDGRETYIEQLFAPNAVAWLKEGATVPIKYDADLKLAMIDHTDAYSRLRPGLQFRWRRR
ncbi:hypothetical protein [Bordetella sp. BOR01]|uniref:hypothetical protein n=1 Tax=Bordetella sp. BOR01 TaxID=2854779 RepID=UPI001C473424|nr:hypothetical protein [Bordetella sp. BOR01]MBV7481800.1 hypothetical protein [Bordetella sp. BOR01]